MFSMIEVRWLLLLLIGFLLTFVSWTFWNLAREIWAERRRWVHKYSEPREASRPARPARLKVNTRSGFTS